MCLAIPAKIVSIDEDNLAMVDIIGVSRQIALDLTPAAKVGDYVLVHAGFAIEIVDPDYAAETIELIKEFPELADGVAPADVQPSSSQAPSPLTGLSALADL